MRSTRTRLGAAITAGVALSAIGVLSLTSGTVAELSDQIAVRADVGVAAVPYGIARGVSYSVNFQRLSGGYASETESQSTTVNSRTGAAHQLTVDPVQHNLVSGGLDLLAPQHVRACASSDLGGNTTRCPGTPASGALVSASSGNLQTVQKYKNQWKDLASSAKQILDTHDIFTHVQCRTNGTVSAATPIGSWHFGGTGSLRTRKWGFFEAGTGRTNSGDLPEANTYARYRLWTGNEAAGHNTSMTVEVQSIAREYANPPRAVSALVFHVSAGDTPAQNRLTDMALVSKSECAVSEDGTEITDEVFEPLIPTFEPQPLPKWDGRWNYFLQNPAPIVENSPARMRSAVTGQDSGIELLETGDLEFERPESTDNAEQSTGTSATQTTSSAPSPTSTARATLTSNSTPPNSPNSPTRSSTTSSAGPDPTTTEAASGTSYTSPTGQVYARDDRNALSSTQKKLVEQAIAAAATADTGELPGGASYAVTANQLDGTTLIVTTADGGTLRIVWEK